MLNARLYRTAWLIAGVAIIVALLTLQPPTGELGERPSVPQAAEGRLIRDVAERLRALEPRRPPGDPATEVRAADWVARQFAQLPTVGATPTAQRVRRQEFSARIDGRLQKLVNVYVALPGSTDGIQRGGIVVMAPRDNGPGAVAGSSSTSMMLELARVLATSNRRRPMLFVSTSGSTVGNAGARWFLSRFHDFPITAVIALDGTGETAGPLWVWSGSRAATQALGFETLTRSVVTWSGATPAPQAGLWTQLLRFAVPQTFGDQAPFVEHGIPAITLSSRPDGPPRPTDPFDADRLSQAGNVALTLVGVIDAGATVPPPASSLLFAGKEMPPTVLRVVMMLLALPLWVAAIDAFARLRRAGVRLGPGLVAVWWRSLPLVVAAFALHILALVQMLPAPSSGVPPLPREVGFGAREFMALVVVALLAVGAWLVSRRAMRRLTGTPAGEAAAGLVVLAAVTLVAWIFTPFMLVLTLPAAHAVLAATSVRRTWQAVALAVVAIIPLLALCLSVGSQLGRNPLFSAWYLTATTAGGARGTLWPALALLLASAIVSVAILAYDRARRGLMRRDQAPPRPPRDGLSGRGLRSLTR